MNEQRTSFIVCKALRGQAIGPRCGRDSDADLKRIPKISSGCRAPEGTPAIPPSVRELGKLLFLAGELRGYRRHANALGGRPEKSAAKNLPCWDLGSPLCGRYGRQRSDPPTSPHGLRMGHKALLLDVQWTTERL